MKNLPGFIAALMLPIIFCPIIAHAFTGDVVKKFPTPGQYPTGIAKMYYEMTGGWNTTPTGSILPNPRPW